MASNFIPLVRGFSHFQSLLRFAYTYTPVFYDTSNMPKSHVATNVHEGPIYVYPCIYH